MLGAGQQHTAIEYGITSPSGSMLLARGQSSALSRLSTVVPSAAAGDSNANNKQADTYISELLSYSLDRLHKVRGGRVALLASLCTLAAAPPAADTWVLGFGQSTFVPGPHTTLLLSPMACDKQEGLVEGSMAPVCQHSY